MNVLAIFVLLLHISHAWHGILIFSATNTQIWSPYTGAEDASHLGLGIRNQPALCTWGLSGESDDNDILILSGEDHEDTLLFDAATNKTVYGQ